MRWWRPIVVASLFALALALAAKPGRAPVAAADSDATLRIEPAVVKVVGGAEFAVQLVQVAPVASSGAQASIEFDPSILQIVSVSPVGAYAQAPFILPKDIAEDVRSANHSGKLAQVAAAFLPPTSVPPGSAPFLAIGFRAVGCGETSLDLPVGALDAQMIDGREGSYGEPLTVGTTGGSVTTCVDASDATPTASLASASDGIPFPLVAAAAVLLIVVIVGGLALSSRRRREPSA